MTESVTPELAVETLHREQCAGVIVTSQGSLILARRRGVIDLLELLPSLEGSFIADKVVGKGAAALMVIGGVTGVHADVISRPALSMLRDYGVNVAYTTLTDNIINRSGTDICPVEKLTADCQTAEECLPLIRHFINSINTR